MPVLRSREIPFRHFPTGSNGWPSTPPPSDLHAPPSEDTAAMKTPKSTSLGLGSGWRRRRRRSLRLAAAAGKAECETNEDVGPSAPKRKRNDEEEVVRRVDLSLQVRDVGRKGKSVAAVEESVGVGDAMWKCTREEKGKGIFADESPAMRVEGEGAGATWNAGDSPSLSREMFDCRLMDVYGERVPTPAAEVAAAQDAIDRCNTRREQDRARALASAPKFALYSPEECPKDDIDEDDGEGWEPVAEDWPGPFATAEKILNDRARGVPCQFPVVKSSQDEIRWIPSVRPKCSRVVPSLRSLCMEVLAKNSSAIESLEGIPDGMRQQISFLLCRSRSLDYHFLSLLSSGYPTQICVADCSWASEEGVKEILANCNTEELEVLKLDLSGRCLPDYILSSTLAHSPNSLPKLTAVSLSGDYRLSDIGLNSLICSAPKLCSVNLSHCSLLTSAGITTLAEKLETVLRELILDDCSNVDALTILPALKRVKNLEKLSMSGLQSVNAKFVSGLLSVHGAKMKALGFAGCRKVSLNSIKAIGLNCHQLCDLDLCNVHSLDDNAIKHLPKACLSIRKLMLQHSDCSDEAVAAFLDTCGRCLQELSLNNFKEVGHKTAVSICRRCTGLRSLDLSFCRMMKNEALGLIVDSCSALQTLKLFGCTQVTGLFLNGHSNPHVEIIGLRGSILKQLDKELEYR